MCINSFNSFSGAFLASRRWDCNPSGSTTLTVWETYAVMDTTLTSLQDSTENTKNSIGGSGTTDERDNSTLTSSASSKDGSPDVDSKSGGYMLAMGTIIFMMVAVCDMLIV